MLMNDDSTGLEAHLRQMKPVACGHLKDDAMYRAGWNSAEAVRALRNHTVVPARKSFRVFASGMMCGVLMCGVGLSAWQFSRPDHSVADNRVVAKSDVVPPVGAKSAALDASLIAEETAIAPATASANTALTSFTELLMPWWNPTDTRSLDLTPAAARPLSRAAQCQWSHMLLPDSTVLAERGNFGHTINDNIPVSPRLRVGSPADQNIEDLL